MIQSIIFNDKSHSSAEIGHRSIGHLKSNGLGKSRGCVYSNFAS